jgi:hypothetical protein
MTSQCKATVRILSFDDSVTNSSDNKNFTWEVRVRDTKHSKGSFDIEFTWLDTSGSRRSRQNTFTWKMQNSDHDRFQDDFRLSASEKLIEVEIIKSSIDCTRLD